MAEIALQRVATQRSGTVVSVVWTALSATNNAGTPFFGAHRPDKTITCTGTFGGTVTIQGSPEATPTTWFTLTDAQGNPLTFTAAGTKLVAENTLWIRPVAGAGVSAVNVYLVAVSHSSQAE